MRCVMSPVVSDWFAHNTSTAADWPAARLVELKADARIAVVIPARNEAGTVGEVVSLIATELSDLVDELVVMDSLSSDATVAEARMAGATVHSVQDVRPDLGVQAGKGEALWKSLFVTTSDLLVFIDADLTEWGPHFVTGLLGPLLTQPSVMLVRGFYDRVLDMGGVPSLEGGRVTELVARPWLALHQPELAEIVQPLAGEWAIRRSMMERLSIPAGYGVEFSTLLDVHALHGLDGIAQVDLGRRAHRHQSLHDLGAMATEILAVAEHRRGGVPSGVLSPVDEGTSPARSVVLKLPAEERTWVDRVVGVDERLPAIEIGGYRP